MADKPNGDIYFGDAPNFIDPSIKFDSAFIRPEEKILSVHQVAFAKNHQTLSALQALQQLTRAKRPEDIGKQGPAIASNSFPEDDIVPELNLYEVLFGRDSLIVALFVGQHFPELLKSTVLRLAELQGVEENDWSEEEPGRILHELRDKNDPIAVALTKRYGWQWPFYSTIDATPLFIRALVRYTLTHDLAFLKQEYTDRSMQRKTIADALQAALAWLYRRMDQNKEGLVESKKRISKRGGTVNQAWKDSYDSYHHHDGTLANTEHGISSVEVQAYVHDALLEASELLAKTDLPQKKYHHELCQKYAKQIETILMEKFWIEDSRGGYFALGSDRDKKGRLRILKVRSSNMGHLLNSRLLDGDDQEIMHRKEAVLKTLFANDMLNVAGIRTLSTQENRFRPRSYHNGSVWPWDTYYISLGLLRQGYTAQAQELWRRTASVFKTAHCFPEFVSGEASTTPLIPDKTIKVYDTKYKFEHFIEQPPQAIQAWSVAVAVNLEKRMQGG